MFKNVFKLVLVGLILSFAYTISASAAEECYIPYILNNQQEQNKHGCLSKPDGRSFFGEMLNIDDTKPIYQAYRYHLWASRHIVNGSNDYVVYTRTPEQDPEFWKDFEEYTTRYQMPLKVTIKGDKYILTPHSTSEKAIQEILNNL